MWETKKSALGQVHLENTDSGWQTQTVKLTKSIEKEQARSTVQHTCTTPSFPQGLCGTAQFSPFSPAWHWIWDCFTLAESSASLSCMPNSKQSLQVSEEGGTWGSMKPCTPSKMLETLPTLLPRPIKEAPAALAYKNTAQVLAAPSRHYSSPDASWVSSHTQLEKWYRKNRPTSLLFTNIWQHSL